MELGELLAGMLGDWEFYLEVLTACVFTGAAVGVVVHLIGYLISATLSMLKSM